MELLKINMDIPTPDECKQASARMAEQVIFGEISPIEAHLKLSLIKDMAEDALKQIKPSMEAELDKWGKDKPVIAGYEVAMHNGGNTAKFDNNPEWVALKERMKVIEEQMKAAAKGLTVVDDTTGEVVPPAILVPRADSIRVTYKKSK